MKETKLLENNKDIDIIKKLVTLIGGEGGGGRPELAQGGGPDRYGVKKIIKKIEELI